MKEELFSHIHFYRIDRIAAAEARDLAPNGTFSSTTELASPFLSLDLFWGSSYLSLPSGKTLSFVGKGMLIPLYCAGAKTRRRMK